LFGVIDAEHNQNAASSSTALPTYSFDNIGPSVMLDSSMSAAATNSGRYIQDDPSVLLPDGTSLPLSSLTADGSMFALPGMVDGRVLADFGADNSQSQPTAATAAQIMDPAINNDLSFAVGSDSLSERMTSEELTQFLQSNPVLTEMRSDEFHQQFEEIMFSDSSARPSQQSEH